MKRRSKIETRKAECGMFWNVKGKRRIQIERICTLPPKICVVRSLDQIEHLNFRAHTDKHRERE